MKIKQFKCESFGGLTNKSLDFNDGLNVILGPNEAGKSTVIEGIFAALFKSHQLKQNNSKDKEFNQRFRPYPNGDSMKAGVTFEVMGSTYQIDKKWGISAEASLNIDGQLIQAETTINEKLKELLRYGEGTYGNIVFAKQKALKEALEKISGDEETAEVVGGLLRKAIMALDGISLERLKARVDREHEDMISRWDISNNRPEGNRGIDSPWKKGVGKVLESYYKKEEIRNDMEYAQQIEQQFSAIAEELKKISEEKKLIKIESDKYSGIEEDIFKRASLEPELRRLEEKAQVLREINKEFPVKENKLIENKERIEGLQKKEGNLKSELEIAKRIEKAEDVRALVAKVKEKATEINQIQVEQNGQVTIEEKDLKRLKELQSTVLRAKASMEAATLIGSLIRSDRKVYITKGLGEKEEVSESTEFTSSGYLKVEIEGSFELEVKAGEIDFETLRGQCLKAELEQKEILEKYQVADLTELEVKHRESKQLEQRIVNLEEQIKALLGETNLKDLEQQLAELQDLKARAVQDIEMEKDSLTGQINDLKIEISSLETTIRAWEKSYGTCDDIIDLLADTLRQLKEKKEQLTGLAQLPDEFASAEEFRTKLLGLRENLERLGDSERNKSEKYYDLQSKLPDISYEELLPMSEVAEEEFNKSLARLKNLVKVRTVLSRKLEEIDTNSFKPLNDSFSKYLSVLTNGSYAAGEISEDFEIEIMSSGKRTMPVNLLSAGTYDTVLLALRFAILDYLFEGREGLVVLDDCLVNLDPNRREKAAELITEFAKNNQVIFTTCDPGIADLLGGNRVAV